MTTKLERLWENVQEVLEARTATDTTLWRERYAQDPVGFVRDVLGAEVSDQQAEVLESVFLPTGAGGHRFTGLVSGNGQGKSVGLALACLVNAFVRGGLTVLTGPTHRQIKSIVFGTFGRYWREAGLGGELFAETFRGGEYGDVMAFTAKSASEIQGQHDDNLLLLVDEAQGVDNDDIWAGLHSMMTQEHNRFLAAGNPLHASGEFYRLSRDPTWHTIHWSAEACPYVSDQFVESMAAMYGRDSDMFRSRIHGLFPVGQDANALLERRWVEEAVARGKRAAGNSHGFWTFALDPARKGESRTALAAKRGDYIAPIHILPRCDLMETVAEVRRILREDFGIGVLHDIRVYGPCLEMKKYHLVVDSVALGQGVSDRLKELGYRVDHFYGGGKPQGKKHPGVKFLNRRAACGWALRLALSSERATLCLPDDPALIEELLAIRWTITPSDAIALESKAVMHTHLGRSPDRADALLMCFAHQRRVSGLVTMMDL